MQFKCTISFFEEIQIIQKFSFELIREFYRHAKLIFTLWTSLFRIASILNSKSEPWEFQFFVCILRLHVEKRDTGLFCHSTRTSSEVQQYYLMPAVNCQPSYRGRALSTELHAIKTFNFNCFWTYHCLKRHWKHAFDSMYS